MTTYGIFIPENEKVIFISSKHSKLMMINFPLPTKLGDSDVCQALIERISFEKIMKEEDWKYPMKVKAVFNSNDSSYYSEEITLNKYKINLRVILYLS